MRYDLHPALELCVKYMSIICYCALILSFVNLLDLNLYL